MRLLTTLLFSCLTITALAQQKEAFKITPAIIEQGDKIQIHYNPAVNCVAAETPVKGSVYLFKNFKWQGYDLPLVKSDSGYTAIHEVPKGVAMLACRFAIGDSIDRGGRFPYATVVYAPGRKTESGSFIEWGLLRSKNVNGEMSPLVAKESLIEPMVLVQLWISKEFNNPVVKRNLFFDIANGIKAYLPKKEADSILFKTAAELTGLPDVTEKELISIERVYRSVLNDTAKADVLKANIFSKYPEGLMHRLQLVKRIYTEKDPDQKVGLWDSFVGMFPFSSFPYSDYMDPILGNGSSFSDAYLAVTNRNFQKHDLVKVSRLVNEGPFQMIDCSYEQYVIDPFGLSVSPLTVKEALFLSTSFTDVIMKRMEVGSLEDRGLYAPGEWIKQEMTHHTGVWVHHIGLLSQSKQYEAALKFADRVKDFMGYQHIDFNTGYAKLLYHFRRNDVAKAYVVEAIKSDAATQEIIALLKADYLKVKGNSQKSFDTYYESLKPDAKLKRLQKT